MQDARAAPRLALTLLLRRLSPSVVWNFILSNTLHRLRVHPARRALQSSSTQTRSDAPPETHVSFKAANLESVPLASGHLMATHGGQTVVEDAEYEYISRPRRPGRD